MAVVHLLVEVVPSGGGAMAAAKTRGTKAHKVEVNTDSDDVPRF